MAKAKNNDLKLSDLKKERKSLDKLETYNLSNGTDLHFNPVFDGNKIQLLLEEFQEKALYMNEKGIEMDDKMTIQYVQFLCIKYFTHLKKDIPDEYTFEQQLEVMEILMFKGYYEEILNDVLPVKEIQRVFDKMTTFVATGQYLDKIQGEVQTKIQDLDLKHKDEIMNAFGKFNTIENNKIDIDDTTRNVKADKLVNNSANVDGE